MKDNKELNEKKSENLTDEQMKDVDGGYSARIKYPKVFENKDDLEGNNVKGVKSSKNIRC